MLVCYFPACRSLMRRAGWKCLTSSLIPCYFRGVATNRISASVKPKRGMHPNSLKNLIPFAPGTNGYNPGTMSLKERLRHRLAFPLDKIPPPVLVADQLAQSMIEGALLREPTPLIQVCERVDGKVPQPVSGSLELLHNITFIIGKGYEKTE